MQDQDLLSTTHFLHLNLHFVFFNVTCLPGYSRASEVWKEGLFSGFTPMHSSSMHCKSLGVGFLSPKNMELVTEYYKIMNKIADIFKTKKINNVSYM